MSEQVLAAHHVMRQMAERVEAWRAELSQLVQSQTICTSEMKYLDLLSTDLDVACHALRGAAKHVEGAIVEKHKAREARKAGEAPKPPPNPEQSCFPLNRASP